MKKNLFLPLVILGLMAAFLLACFFVTVSRGKGSWIRRKLRLGGIILSLSAGAIACGDDDCYAGVSPSFYPCDLTNSQTVLYTNTMVMMDLSITNILYCKLQYGPTSADYIFTSRIKNAEDTLVASNKMDLITFPDPAMEPRYAVTIDPALPDGQYQLSFVGHYTNGTSWQVGWDIPLSITR